MAYKNKEGQRAADRRWWARNKDTANKKRYERRNVKRKWFLEYKANLACVKCGENDPVCIDLHHLNPKSKKEEVSMLLQHNWSLEVIKAEVDKCIPLCANCHRREHHEQKKRDRRDLNTGCDAPNVE